MSNTMMEVTELALKHGTRAMQHPLLSLNGYFDATQRAAIHEAAQEDASGFRDYEEELKKAIVQRDIEANGCLIVRALTQKSTDVDTWKWCDKRPETKIRGTERWSTGYFFVRANRDGELIGTDAEVFTGEGNQQIAVYSTYRDGLMYNREVRQFGHPKQFETRLYGGVYVPCEWFLTVEEYYDWCEASPHRATPPANSFPQSWDDTQKLLKVFVGVGAEYRAWMME
jgi:hypothetical protein